MRKGQKFDRRGRLRSTMEERIPVQSHVVYLNRNLRSTGQKFARRGRLRFTMEERVSVQSTVVNLNRYLGSTGQKFDRRGRLRSTMVERLTDQSPIVYLNRNLESIGHRTEGSTITQSLSFVLPKRRSKLIFSRSLVAASGTYSPSAHA